MLFVPVGIGAILLALTTTNDLGNQVSELDAYEGFEYTVWGDSTPNGKVGSFRMVQLSDREITKASLLVLQNQQKMIPFVQPQRKHFFLISVGKALPRLKGTLNLYTSVPTVHFESISDIEIPNLKTFNPIIVALNEPEDNPFLVREFLEELRQSSEVVIVNFGDHDILRPIADFPTIVQTPNNRGITQELVGQLLFGGVGAYRSIPEEMAADLKLERNYQIAKTRLAYSEPEYVGISSDSLAQIEAIVGEAMDNFAVPGCQVLIAKEGHVIYHQAFGYHTYDRKEPVRKSDLYDLASITKVASTTLAAMKLYEEGRMKLDDPLKEYFVDQTYIPSPYKVFDTLSYEAYFAALAQPDSLADSLKQYVSSDTIRFQDSMYLVGRWIRPRRIPRQSRIFDIPLSELLTHTSGLQASLPLYTFQNFRNQHMYKASFTSDYPIAVAERMYLNQTYMDSLWNVAKGLRRDSARYRYSCVNMILLQKAIDSLNRQPINEFLDTAFYGPLGLQTACYNPRELFDPERIVPTSSDRWRGQLLCGTVHDPTAALMGGISGNAGLFSNANDLAILFQMLLNGGSYGGQRFLEDSTVELFTRRQKGHRGFGFDKPPRQADYIVAESASYNSFGHTGFTGTCVWADPENDLIFVFLSNRIHPSVKNYKLNELRIRQRIHQVVYNALGIPYRVMPPSQYRRPNRQLFTKVRQLAP